MASDILIVDDEADIRELIAGILTDEGYETRAAADGRAALAEIEVRLPSLLVLDIHPAHASGSSARTQAGGVVLAQLRDATVAR